MVWSSFPKAARRQKGLTLLELLIAVLVVTILVSVGVPSFQGLNERLTLRGAAFHLFELIHQGKSEALKRDLDGVSLKFVQDTTQWCVRLTDTPDQCKACDDSANCAIGNDGVIRGMNGSDYDRVTLDVATTFTSNSNELSITQRRGSLTSGNAKFTLGADKSACVVTSSMGRARLCYPEGKEAIWGMDSCGGNVCN